MPFHGMAKSDTSFANQKLGLREEFEVTSKS